MVESNVRECLKLLFTEKLDVLKVATAHCTSRSSTLDRKIRILSHYMITGHWIHIEHLVISDCSTVMHASCVTYCKYFTFIIYFSQSKEYIHIVLKVKQTCSLILFKIKNVNYEWVRNQDWQTQYRLMTYHVLAHPPPYPIPWHISCKHIKKASSLSCIDRLTMSLEL